MDFFWILPKRIIKVNKILRIVIFLPLFIFLGTNPGHLRANPSDFSDIIGQVSSKYGLEEGLLYKIIEAESSFNPQAVSKCDARGLMQITQKTWNWICRDFLDVQWNFEQDAFDPDKNIKVGACFLHWISGYLDKNEQLLNDNKINLMLACYNAGPGAVKNYGFRIPPFEETANYVYKINNL
ncbi:MAG: lytic transglycosylase domain-containing protein [Candidatus Omnitrophota bacterium]